MAASGGSAIYTTLTCMIKQLGSNRNRARRLQRRIELQQQGLFATTRTPASYWLLTVSLTPRDIFFATRWLLFVLCPLARRRRRRQA